MANTAPSDARRAKKTRVETSRFQRRSVDTNVLRAFLDTLNVGVNPAIHVNGHAYGMALVCVDFGSPLQQARLSPEETHALNDHLKALAREVIGGKDVNIRISHDGPNGVYWASIV